MEAEELAQLKSTLLGLENGFSIKSAAPIDGRFLMTKAEMLTVNEAEMPSIYFTLCIGDGNLYVYNKDNTKDAVTGKFRALTDIANLAQALRYVGTINNTASVDPTTDIESFYADKMPAVGDVLNLVNDFIYNGNTYSAGTNVIISEVSVDDSSLSFSFDPLGGIFDTTEINTLISNAIANTGHITDVATTGNIYDPFSSLSKSENTLNVTNNYGFTSDEAAVDSALTDKKVKVAVFGE